MLTIVAQAEWTGGKDRGDEAQVMLKHKNTYHLIISQGCCFCSSGAPAFVYTAPHPLGPFTYRARPSLPAVPASVLWLTLLLRRQRHPDARQRRRRRCEDASQAD